MRLLRIACTAFVVMMFLAHGIAAATELTKDDIDFRAFTSVKQMPACLTACLSRWATTRTANIPWCFGYTEWTAGAPTT